MSSSFRILLFDRSLDPAATGAFRHSSYQAVICLFWAAPSTRKALSAAAGAPCYGIREIVGSEMEWDKAAYELAVRFVQEGPRYRDLACRTYLAESLYREVHGLQLLLMTVSFMERLRATWSAEKVEVEAAMDKTALSLLSYVLYSHPAVVLNAPKEREEGGSSGPGEKSLPARLVERLKESLLTGGWKMQSREMIEWADKTCALRSLLGGMLTPPAVRGKGVTFFSSYANNSRILSFYTALMPSPVSWIVTTYSALSEVPAGQDVNWVWRFHGPAEKTQDIGRDGGLSPFGEDAKVLEKWLEKSSVWRDWMEVESSLLANLTRCWEAYLEGTKPCLVVMANQWGIEGWFTGIAQRHGIPVLQIMHGVLGGYLYTRTPVISDGFVVCGEFWRNLWPEEQRNKIAVFNPAGHIAGVEKKRSEMRRLTFFSWPLHLAGFYNPSEIMEGLIRIFHRLIEEGLCEITVRAHPLENPSHFTDRWKTLYGALPAGLHVGKHEPLDSILEKTDVALMFRSTVMLNCMMCGIPVVMPGWIDYGWNAALNETDCIYLADDFDDLEERLARWLENPPVVSSADMGRFVRTGGEGGEEFFSKVRELANSESLAG